MAELKTKKTDVSVEKFLNSVPDEQKRKDAFGILQMMKQASRLEPKLWGSSIIGFGDIHLKYESGRELDWFILGFSPRKENLTLYLCGGLQPYEEELKSLGKYKTSKGCLYFNKLDDIDSTVLKNILKKNMQQAKAKK